MKWCLCCLKRNDRARLERRLAPIPLVGGITSLCSDCLAMSNAQALLLLARNAGWSARQLIADLDQHWIGHASETQLFAQEPATDG